MKPIDDINRLIKKLQVKASTKLDRRVHDDISRAIVESERVVGLNIWRMKLAVAAAIVIAFGVGFFIGQQSKSAQSATYSIDVTSYTPAVSAYLPDESSFWRQKAVAAMQPRPYTQSRFDKTELLKTYKQYLKEKYYD